MRLTFGLEITNPHFKRDVTSVDVNVDLPNCTLEDIAVNANSEDNWTHPIEQRLCKESSVDLMFELKVLASDSSSFQSLLGTYPIHCASVAEAATQSDNKNNKKLVQGTNETISSEFEQLFQEWNPDGMWTLGMQVNDIDPIDKKESITLYINCKLPHLKFSGSNIEPTFNISNLPKCSNEVVARII